MAWLTATQSLSALQKGELSSRELLDQLVARIEQHNPAVNAVVVTDFDRARKQAAQADTARARGQPLGRLHGLPMTVKECFDVEGLPTTSGSPSLRSNRAVRHADAVQKLVDAGAIIFGKTNTPLFAGDLQTYNAVYGTTHNPWDLKRGPGGSSGGAAAALAAGMTPLELGSDIGGSIRNPAHFCGIYGHKPSFGIVPLRGHVPGPPNSLSTADIGVAGPMARSVEDLALGLDVLASPGEWDAVAWRLTLPEPRHKSVKDYRIAVCADHSFCQVDREIADAIGTAADALGRAGAKVGEATPDLDFAEAFRVYYRLLAGALSPGVQPPQSEAMALRVANAAPDDHDLVTLFARGATRRHAEHLRDVEHRQRQRAVWAEFFRTWDVLLCPMILTAAFPHDQSADMSGRRLVVNGVERSYFEMVGWAGLIGNVRLPSTVVPIGHTKDGLPIGMQVVGPYLEDRTALDVARHVEQLIGGFVPPPGFA